VFSNRRGPRRQTSDALGRVPSDVTDSRQVVRERRMNLRE
jgi:hypothetical protein